MKGTTHAMIGAAIPVGALATGTSLVDSVILAAVSTGFALGPDIDHPKALISTALPRAVHEAAHGASVVARRLTCTPADHHYTRRREEEHQEKARLRGEPSPLPIDPNHRALTHTAMAALIVGLVAYAIALIPHAGAIVATMALVSCRGAVPNKFKGLFFGVVAGVLVISWQHPVAPELIGIFAAAGWLSHILADACTTMGVPLLWPFVWKNRRWRHVRLLGSWLRSGDRKEVFAAAGIAVFMNLPYVPHAWIG